MTAQYRAEIVVEATQAEARLKGLQREVARAEQQFKAAGRNI